MVLILKGVLVLEAIGLNSNLGEELLKVHKSYLKLINTLKEKIEDENFNIYDFLKLIILLLSNNAQNKENLENWHKIMELFKNLEYYNLNQKIQLKYF